MKSTLYLNEFNKVNVHSVSKANLDIRLSFLRKVYGILSCQLILTLLIGLFFYLIPNGVEYVLNNRWHIDIALISSIVLMGLLYFKRHQSPLNFVLLFSFTLCQAYMLGTTMIFYKASLLIKSLVLTMAAFVGLHIYAMQTKRDFSKWGQMLITGMWVLCLAGIIQYFYPMSGFEFGLSILGTALFCLYIVYDVQILMTKLSPEEYVIASLTLYLDTINLFLQILKLLKSSEKRNKN
ncbi:unnamed protein product [Gordionus sp. m RMFG-2023]|uniref:protein lifeguard 4-like n=1 Tax=Gordionus sp. m RMFG-2023 TaxID=3053472 RepID=UPI0030E49436